MEQRGPRTPQGEEKNRARGSDRSLRQMHAWPESRPPTGRSPPPCLPTTVEEEQPSLLQLSWCCLHLSPTFTRRRRASHHCGGNRGQVPGGAGGGGRFGDAWAGGPDVGIGGRCGGRAQPGAHAALGEGARPALGAARLQLLALGQPAALSAPLEEVRQHLAFALHADLAAAHEVVVVCNEAINVLCHLEGKHRGLMFAASCTHRNKGFTSVPKGSVVRKSTPKGAEVVLQL